MDPLCRTCVRQDAYSAGLVIGALAGALVVVYFGLPFYRSAQSDRDYQRRCREIAEEDLSEARAQVSRLAADVPNPSPLTPSTEAPPP